MDLTIYYQKIRDEQAKIAEEFPVMVSLETEDGGKRGVQTEVSRALAARMIVNGVARRATATETKAFHEAKTEAKRQADAAAAAAKMEFDVVPKKR
jgi:hypothetical protein